MIIAGRRYENTLEEIVRLSSGKTAREFEITTPRLIITKEIKLKPYGADFFNMLRKSKYFLYFRNGRFHIKYDGNYIKPAKIFYDWLSAGIEFVEPISDKPVEEVIKILEEVLHESDE